MDAITREAVESLNRHLEVLDERLRRISKQLLPAEEVEVIDVAVDALWTNGKTKVFHCGEMEVDILQFLMDIEASPDDIDLIYNMKVDQSEDFSVPNDSCQGLGPMTVVLTRVA